jgi:hypothetical protein
MIVPVNVPPSQLQVIQSPALDRLSNSAPNLTATPSLKKKAQPVLYAQASTNLNKLILAAEPQNSIVPQTPANNLQNTLGSETQLPKVKIFPSPFVSPKELLKSEQPNSEKPKSDQLVTPDSKLQNPEPLSPSLQPSTPEAKPESKEQQKPEAKPLVPDGKEQPKPEQTMPATQPEQAPETKQDAKEQPKPEQTMPATQPEQAPETKQDAKEQPKPEQVMPEAQPQQDSEIKQDNKQRQSPPLPSEVLPSPAQQQENPLPSGPPKTEPANYPDNTGPGAAYYNQNYIAPSVSFGRDTLIGATSRFGISKNISIRPSLFLGNTARVAVPVTYDFGFNDNEQFEKNPLVVFHAGGGLDYSSRSGSNTSSLNPLVVFGADVYLGDGASVLLQIGNTFNSDFIAVAGVGLQF